MATLTELYTLSQNPDLLGKISAAIAILAETIRLEIASGSPPGTLPQRISWAVRAIQNPDGEARRMIWLLLAQNKTLTVTQITNASDTAIQNAVNAAIELFM